jgi:sensor histidine kinase YesM
LGKVPPLIVQPYVENAIWHGLLHKESDGILKIRVYQQSTVLLIEVLDNGIGRKKAAEYKSSNAPTRKSIGLKLTEERIHLSGKENSFTLAPEIIDLYNESGEACGTQVIIRINL